MKTSPIIRILSLNKTISKRKLLTAVNREQTTSERSLRKQILSLIKNGAPIRSDLKGYSIIKSWKDWEKADNFLLTYIRDLQARRTRLKKNVRNFLVKPKLVA